VIFVTIPSILTSLDADYLHLVKQDYIVRVNQPAIFVLNLNAI
jgi:hypothetical protein